MNSELKYKTGAKRLLAAIIDALVLMPLTLLDESVRTRISSQIGLITWTLAIPIVICLYSVIMHFKYGQTLGKMATGVKVLNVDERQTLTIGQALARDIIYLCLQISAILYTFIWASDYNTSSAEISEKYDNIVLVTAMAWLTIELLTMLANKKKRSFHDFIANSVVIRLSKEKQ